MKRVLIVEDDKGISELERDYLEAEGFSVVIEDDGTSGLKRATIEKFDLIILDVMLPGVDGFQICREIRTQSEVPILLVTAKGEDIDKIRGMGIGADDYVVKPFSPAELVARAKGHIKRYERLMRFCANNKTRYIDADNLGVIISNKLVADDLEVQTDTHRVFRMGKEINLTNREFQLLEFFIRNRGIVFSKNDLFEKVWGLDAVGDTSTVMVHVNRLREKIEPDLSNPKYIQTVWGVGYRFN